MPTCGFLGPAHRLLGVLLAIGPDVHLGQGGQRSRCPPSLPLNHCSPLGRGGREGLGWCFPTLGGGDTVLAPAVPLLPRPLGILDPSPPSLL